MAYFKVRSHFERQINAALMARKAKRQPSYLDSFA